MTDVSAHARHLFESVSIRSMTLANRIVLPPMTTMLANAMVQIDPTNPPVAPSAIPYPGGQTPRALAEDEIEEIVHAFGRAARRAAVAGFDAVDIHGGHGYLIAQFMSAYFNRRTDGYGGDLMGRLRFAREVLREVLAAFDTVVLALGAEPENRLARELEGKVAELHVIGDARQPASALAAIAAGNEVGRQL
jgi:2,4-dienoyl-CoA reductase-like NADH-dependent reductase (Old Yellow Enzyme family)